MTVTLFIEHEKVKVDNSLLRSSELVKSVIIDLGQDDVDIFVPSRYAPVIDYYLDFIHKISYDKEGEVIYPASLPIIDNTNDLFLCFFMETFFGDSTFFSYLMRQAYGIWHEFYPIISLLPDERLIYLYTPYELVPDEYMDRESFFKEWLQINANTATILNGNDLYRTAVTYYPSGRVKELKARHAIEGTKISSHEERWYDNPKRQAEYRDNYKDGKLDGLQEYWYANGQARYRHNYKDGKWDGLWERWYAGGQREYRQNYKDGKRDGLWEAWYENGQLEYRKVYDMGTLIS